jgi:branched-chain amino acid transport system permease protein
VPSTPANLLDRGRALRPSAASGLLRAILPVAVAMALALLLHFLVRPLLNKIDPFYPRVLLDIGINVILAVSLTMVNGFTGQFSMGHAAFMSVGAYTAAGIVYYGSYRIWGDAMVHGGTLSGLSPDADTLITGADALFFLALIVGGLVAALCGYLVGLPSLRLRGDYLAIVTLGFGEIVRVVITSQTVDTLYDAEEIAGTAVWRLPKYLGGPVGFTGLPFYTSLFWVWLFAVLTLAVAYRLKESTFGRAFLSIREDEIAAEAMGVKTTKYKIRAFVIAAFFAGIAGGLYAHTIGVQLTANELGFQRSFDIIIMVVLGGMGSISGAAIAAAILSVLPEFLRNPPSVLNPLMLGLIAFTVVVALIFTERKLRGLIVIGAVVALYEALRRGAAAAGINLAEYRMIIYALALILMMILRPQGLFGLRELWSAWRVRPLRKRRDFAAGGKSGTSGEVPTL